MRAGLRLLPTTGAFDVPLVATTTTLRLAVLATTAFSMASSSSALNDPAKP